MYELKIHDNEEMKYFRQHHLVKRKKGWAGNRHHTYLIFDLLNRNKGQCSLIRLDLSYKYISIGFRECVFIKISKSFNQSSFDSNLMVHIKRIVLGLSFFT